MKNPFNTSLSKFGILFCILFTLLGCEEEIQLSPPEVITGEITSATSSSAKVSGQIVLDGNTPIIESGVVYGKSADPTVSDSKVVSTAKSGTFTVDLTGLDFATTYHIRVFATNKIGTSYGLNKSFNTEAVLPTVKTLVVSDIKSKTAVGGGEILNDGGSTITARGVCWNTSPNPTISNNKTFDGSGVGNFTSPIGNLTYLTKYYVRGYATNSIGTSYGEELSFTTINPIYLDQNGVTIKAFDWATVGEKGMVDGKEFLVVDQNELKNLISNGGSLNSLCTSKITDMQNFFKGSSYNGDLSNWDVSNVKNMAWMFARSKFNGDISKWNVSNVNDMSYMFLSSEFNGDLANWDVSNVIDMNQLFSDSKFTGDLGKWNVGNVTNMFGMFSLTKFNRDISKWNVGKVTKMGLMFWISDFNDDLSNWNVMNVTDMFGMFSPSCFNGNISNWNVGNVTNMSNMFCGSITLSGGYQKCQVYNETRNLDLSKWNVQNVQDCSFFSCSPSWTLPKPLFNKCTPN